ncbi:NTP transferase domain-containing protein [Pseudozobellia sp. WGM2]|uniref:nucleotidyltransferase family protein n=1 Tax=Pseudozobellia sp. WGM2 TaxID=2787625 RepID=UPI001ADFDC3F|nr:nucleotidyltransferase family protein [Pseudozobellia sp. WGM2]
MLHSVNNIAIIILAAGSSSRMGRPKQLLSWGKSDLIGNAIEQAKNSRSDKIIVVLGANAQLIKDNISRWEVDFVENENWKSGLGSSLAKGVKHLIELETFDGILVMLADQPLIDSAYLNLLIESFYTTSYFIIATAYSKRAGVPALFDKKFFESLCDLGEDNGAKLIIEQFGHEVLSLDPGKKATDIDTEVDYKKLTKRLNE